MPDLTTRPANLPPTAGPTDFSPKLFARYIAAQPLFERKT